MAGGIGLDLLLNPEPEPEFEQVVQPAAKKARTKMTKSARARKAKERRQALARRKDANTPSYQAWIGKRPERVKAAWQKRTKGLTPADIEAWSYEQHLRAKRAAANEKRRNARVKKNLTPEQRKANALKALAQATMMKELRKDDEDAYFATHVARMKNMKKYQNKTESSILRRFQALQAGRKQRAGDRRAAGLKRLLDEGFTEYGTVKVPAKLYQNHKWKSSLYDDDLLPKEIMAPYYSADTLRKYANNELTKRQKFAADKRAQFRLLYKKYGGHISQFGTLQGPRRKKGDPPRVRPITKNTRIIPKYWGYQKSKLPNTKSLNDWYSDHYLGIPENKRHAGAKVTANAKLRAQIRYMRAHPDAVYNLTRFQRAKPNQVLIGNAALNNAYINDKSPIV